MQFSAFLLHCLSLFWIKWLYWSVYRTRYVKPDQSQCKKKQQFLGFSISILTFEAEYMFRYVLVLKNNALIVYKRYRQQIEGICSTSFSYCWIFWLHYNDKLNGRIRQDVYFIRICYRSSNFGLHLMKMV